MDSTKAAIESKLGKAWPQYAAYALVAGVIITFVSLLIKKLVDSNDEEQ